LVAGEEAVGGGDEGARPFQGRGVHGGDRAVGGGGVAAEEEEGQAQGRFR